MIKGRKKKYEEYRIVTSFKQGTSHMFNTQKSTVDFQSSQDADVQCSVEKEKRKR